MQVWDGEDFPEPTRAELRPYSDTSRKRGRRPGPRPQDSPKPPKPAQQPDLSKCGTYAGYQRHRRYNEPTCEPCRAANTAYQLELRARRRAQRRV